MNDRIPGSEKETALPGVALLRRLALVLSAAAAALLVGCVSPPAPVSSEPEVQGKFYGDPAPGRAQARLEAAVVEEMNAQGVPALQLAVHGASEQIELAFGSATPDRAEPVTTEHLFRVGSVTKLYTATVILRLVEEGRLTLDGSVEGWFPEIPGSRRITLRTLLSHRTGLPEQTDDLFPLLGVALRPNREREPQEFVRRARKEELLFEPGTEYRYSNTNYILLGLIAEAATGEAFAALLEEYITTPLGLENTYLAPPPAATAAAPEPTATGSLITGYDYDVLPLGNHTIRPENRAWPSWAYTAGGLVTSADEMARFLSAVVQGRLLSDASLEAMTDFYPVEERQMPAMRGYGLGMRLLEVDGRRLYGHTGTIPGFGALLFYCPETEITIAAAANRSLLDQTALLAAMLPLLGK